MSDLLPFSRDQFFGVFEAYNEVTWPAPVVAYAIGIVVAVPLLARRRTLPAAAHAFATLGLALMWAWTVVVYHGLFFSEINPAAIAFAALFVIQSGLFVTAARSMRFGTTNLTDTVVANVFIVYALILYPAIGYWTGHTYPATPVFGITPCPVTIFTFGLLLQTEGRPPWFLVAIPALWSLIGGSAAFLLDVAQDWALLLSGFVALAVFAIRR